MPYDRGQWRNMGTGGYEKPNEKPNENASGRGYGGNGPSNQSNVCPLCEKKQPTQRSKCISCGYDFNKKDIDLEDFIFNVKKQKYEMDLKVIQEFVKNNYYNAPYIVDDFSSKIDKFQSLINSKPKDNKILLVSKNKKLISNLKNRLSQNNNLFLKLTENGGNDFKELVELIKKFQEIINSSKYSIKKFKNIESSKLISNFRYLAENSHYINENDAKILNDFIKLYWEFWVSSQSNDGVLEFENKILEKEISNQLDKLIILKKSIFWFNSKIEKLTELYDVLGINYKDIYNKLELMESILFLKNSPHKLDLNEKNEFLNTLEYYQNENNYNEPISVLIENIDDKYVLQLIDGYKKYFDKIYEINQNILELKNQFNLYGFNFIKLNYYYSIKDNLSNFLKAEYLQEDVDLLINKLEEYVINYTNSFQDVINQDKMDLLNYLPDTEYNMDDIKDINIKIIHIRQILLDIGIHYNTIKDIKELEPFCNFNNIYKNYGLIHLLDQFYLKADNKIKLNDYVNNLQFGLKQTIFNIFSNFETDFNKSFKQEYIQHNISIIKNLIKKMGICIDSISDISDEFINISNLSKNSLVSVKNHTNELNDLKMEYINLFTDDTISYLEENDESQILYDLNILNISTQSVLYELSNNPDYMYLDNLSSTFDSFNINSECLEVMDKIRKLFDFDDYKNLIENYSKIFEYCYILIEKSNLNQYEVALDNFKNEFDEVSEIYTSCNSEDIEYLFNNTQEYLQNLKNSQLLYLKLMKLHDERVIDEKTVYLIKNHEFNEYFKDLNDLFDSIEPILVENNFNDFNLDELLNKTNDILLNYSNLINESEEVYSKIKKINLSNFHDIILKIDSYSFIKQNPNFNKVLNDYNLINDILNLYSNLKIEHCKNLTVLSYNELKKFLEFLKTSNNFTKYVNQGIIDKNKFIDFSDEVENIDLKIKFIINGLDDLNLRHNVLDDFSEIKIKESFKIEKLIKKIDENRLINLNDLNQSIKKMKIMINESYYLCTNYPIEYKYDVKSFNSKDHSSNLLKLKNILKNYEKLLKIENKILRFKDIIDKNLAGIWNGFFTDLQIIKNQFSVDEKFMGLYNKGIFTDRTIENLNLFSEDNLNFVNDFTGIMSDEKLKEDYILVYNNQEMFLNEINKLEEYDLTNLMGYKKSFENINVIIKNSKIDECISLLEYYISKEDNTEKYHNKLMRYSSIYYKYFDKTEFNLSIGEIINKLNMHIKCTDLVNDNYIQKSYLDKIKSDKTNFLKEIEKIETLRNDIIAKMDIFSDNYGVDVPINSSTDFDVIKKININKIFNIYLSDDDYIKNNFKNYLSYFDYVISDYTVFDDDLKYYLFLTSKKRLTIVKGGEE